MPERLNGHDWKSCDGGQPRPRVRIPPSPLHGSVQRQLRDPRAVLGAVLRAHGGDRRAACDAGAGGPHADERRPQAARGADHDAAGRTGAPGAQRGGRASSSSTRTTTSCLIGNPRGCCSRSACAMRRPSALLSPRARRRTSRARSDRLSARSRPWRTRSRGTSPTGARRVVLSPAAVRQPQSQWRTSRCISMRTSSHCFESATAIGCAVAFDLWSLDDVATNADAIRRPPRGRHDAMRRSVARRAGRRLPPLDRRRQARVGLRRRRPRIGQRSGAVSGAGVSRCAIRAASIRLGTSSLRRMCETWTLAVLTLMTSSVAISRLV